MLNTSGLIHKTFASVHIYFINPHTWIFEHTFQSQVFSFHRCKCTALILSKWLLKSVSLHKSPFQVEFFQAILTLFQSESKPKKHFDSLKMNKNNLRLYISYFMTFVLFTTFTLLTTSRGTVSLLLH